MMAPRWTSCWKRGERVEGVISDADLNALQKAVS